MQTDGSDLKQLLADLNCKLRPVREAAIARARTLSGEQVKALSELEGKSKSYSQYEEAIGYGVCLTSFALVCGGISLYASSLMGEIISFGLLACAARMFWKCEKPFAHDFLHNLLVEMWKPATIRGALYAIHEHVSTENSTEAQAIYAKTSAAYIKEYLQREQVFPFTTLSSSHLSAILHLFESPYDDVDRTILLLRAMDTIGDEKILNVVTRLAREPRATPNMIAVSDAARVTRRKIEERIAKLQAGKTLLRAASGPVGSSSDVLLRPAASNPDTTPAEQLLRPVSSEE